MRPEEQLHPLFKGPICPIGDPGPELYLLFRDLELKRQVQIVSTLVDARAKIADVIGQAYRQIGTTLKDVGGR